MDKPNYVLRTNGRVTMPKRDTITVHYLKRAIFWLIVLMIIFGLVFRDFSRILHPLVIMIVAFLMLQAYVGKCAVPFPLELRFYDTYLVLYREKYYYNTKLSRMEFDTFYYKDIKKCEYKALTHRINIFGVVEGIWYDYQKDGSVSTVPSHHKKVDSISYFYTDMAPEIDFVAEIEHHSPIKVDILENM